MKKLYDVPFKKQIRLMIDTDTNCEADDHYAIVHALMTPKADVRGIMAEHYSGRTPGEMEKSYEEILKICRMGGFDIALALKGAETPMPDEETPVESEAADALIAEAMAEDVRPLFVICQGALSNVASAILKKPEICERMLLVIVGGTHYPVGGYEYNTMNDCHAFNVVMKSKVPCWMLPEEVYSTMHVGMMEVMTRVAPCGELGKYMAERTLDTVEHMMQLVPDYSAYAPYDYAIGFPNGESWSLGDSTAIGVLISHNSGQYEEVQAPYVKADGTYEISGDAKTVRWYTSLNHRFILEDFFVKLQYYFG